MRAFHCLYEPLHGRLLEYLVWPPQVDPHHPNTSSYFREYRGFRRLPRLFDARWARTDLFLPPDAHAPGLFRYLDYLAEESWARCPSALFKSNRIGFRLGWLHRHFPTARILHVRRDPESQWQSLVRRAQEHHGRDDVGQESVHFTSFCMGAICDDLAGAYPALAACASRSGHERFLRYWRTSDEEQSRWADLTVSLATLKEDLPSALAEMGGCVGVRFDPEASAAVLARGPAPQASGATRWLRNGLHRAGRAYARLHVRVGSALLHASSAP
jgi:hypothetical protein